MQACRPVPADAETAPLRDPELYQYDFNLPDIAEVWRRGSVIASWLLDLTAAALAKDPALARLRRPSLGFRRRPLDHQAPPSTKACLRPCSPPHFSSVSARAGRLSSRTSCCRRCVTGSGGHVGEGRRLGARMQIEVFACPNSAAKGAAHIVEPRRRGTPLPGAGGLPWLSAAAKRHG